MSEQISLAGYLFKRLQQAGLHAVHGVSGLYNIGLTREAYHAGLEWSTHHNELNAALAADGYARVKGISVLLLSYGFDNSSEEMLSTVSLAITASYEDSIPIVLVFGTPERKAQIQASRHHNSFFKAQPDVLRQHDIFEVLADCFDKITITQEFIVDPKDAISQIDTAIRGCIIQSRPVYLEIPIDLVESMLPSQELTQPLDFNVPPNDIELERMVTTIIVDKIKQAVRPLILVDGGVTSCGLLKEANRLARQTRFPTAATQFSRGFMDETLHNFHGEISDFDEHGTYFTSSDLILYLGPSNIIDWIYPALLESKKPGTIYFNRDSVFIGDQKYELSSKSVVQQILSSLSEMELPSLAPYPDLSNLRDSLEILPTQQNTGLLRYDAYYTFWRRMSLSFRSGDKILIEVNTSQDGARCFVLPRDTTVINYGPKKLPEYMLAIASGIASAQQGLAKINRISTCRRTIVFLGIKGFQKAQQALETIVTQKVNLIIFVINKKAPMVESLMHAIEANHYDSSCWQYSESISFFGAPKDTPYPVCITIARTWGELDTILDGNRIQSGIGLHIVELMIQPRDRRVPLLSEKYGEPPSSLSPKKHRLKQD
ncbi:hypothetical protein N7457_000319 [Penicillium paradoxum]|uniref:uncharacterized protein n=1 Tax=Penicillium paradoxum TaxID=176176 RepID=UPI002547E786|nr:uncharacterized protein N7457_000319 [Penicillium paradoxum]KAJ5793720.1 hypothetical protein N7457_000319 [Penicillium paradoxum]